MRHLLILGAGTAGTMTANRLRRRLDESEWRIAVVDRDDRHVYQPGQLFVPFRAADPTRLVRSRRAQLSDGVDLVVDAIESVDADACTVTLVGGRQLHYDYLVVASGTSPRPQETPGMLGPLWRESIFDFYTLDGAEDLAAALESFDGGRLVVHVTEMPIKCPVAPLEFAFLADSYLRHAGVRDRVELVYATPLPGAFTKPVAAHRLGQMLADRDIAVEPDFMIEHVDQAASSLVSYDGRTVPFDLLVTVPLNMGADFIGASGLGDELNYVPVDKHTLRSSAHENVYALGDASDIPASKAGSTAHFSVDVFVDNFLDVVHGRPLSKSFDGHANCFVESGDGKALLIDFNYDVEPLPGRYPLPYVGPLRLLDETRANHLGKRAFEWVYWHALLPGYSLLLPSHLSMAGKIREPEEA